MLLVELVLLIRDELSSTNVWVLLGEADTLLQWLVLQFLGPAVPKR